MAGCPLNLQNCNGLSALPNISCPTSREGCPPNNLGFAKPDLIRDLRKFSNSLREASKQFSNDESLLAAIIQLQELINTRLTD